MTDFNDYRIFAHIVSTGSMSAAGREMGLSPALVSKRMKKLEERLGVRLLQRTTRQIALTEIGQGFYEHVCNILTSVEEAESYVNKRSASLQGTLKIAAPTSFGRMHIAPHLAKFLGDNPEAQVNLVLSDYMVDLVAEGFDMAVRIAELDDSSYVARKLAPNTRVLCAAPSYLEKYGAPNSVTELAEHQCLAAAVQDSWKLHGPNGVETIKPNAVLRTNSSEVVREALLSGLGIAIRSTWDVGPELSNGTLQVVLPDYSGSPNVGIYALYPSRHFVPTKVSAFINFLSETYGKPPYWDR